VSSHPEGSASGQSLCDALLAHLDTAWSDSGGAARKTAKKVCSIGHADGRKTVYVYHRKTKPSVRIYIEGDPGNPPTDFPVGVPIRVRPRFQSPWEKRFPFFFDLEEGNMIPSVVSSLARRAAEVTPARKTWRDETLPAEEVNQVDIWEGAVRQVPVNAYERNRAARGVCLRRWGTSCVVCHFDFGANYGPVFAGFIHVHHLVPVAAIGERYKLDPANDLRPICPNCHAVIHRYTPPFSIEEAKSLVAQARPRAGAEHESVSRRRGSIR